MSKYSLIPFIFFSSFPASARAFSNNAFTASSPALHASFTMDFGKRREGRGDVSVSIVINAQRTREILLVRERKRERE